MIRLLLMIVFMTTAILLKLGYVLTQLPIKDGSIFLYDAFLFCLLLALALCSFIDTDPTTSEGAENE